MMSETDGVGTSLITSLGLVEGDVLTYLEEHGAATIHGLTPRVGLVSLPYHHGRGGVDPARVGSRHPA